MSTAAFPSLPGIAWPVTRTPIWQTRKQDAVSGKRLNLADWSFPKHRWSVSYNFLRGYSTALKEWAQLEGFFGQMRGGFDSFLYTDPDDYTATLSTIGSGDSTNRSFQLQRYFGSSDNGYTEPIYGPLAITSLVVNATTYGSTQYVLQSWGSTAPGIVTFSSFAPSTGQAVTATFTYAWPVSFDDDKLSFEQFVKQIWNLKQISWTSLK